jgi:hypothetical protein
VNQLPRLRRGRTGACSARLAALLLLMVALVEGGEAVLTLPDPLVPGATLEADLVVRDITQEVQDIKLPAVPGVTWRVSGTSTNVAILNGDVHRTYTASISLRVEAKGSIVFPPIAVTLSDGSTLSTAAVTGTLEAANAALTGEAYAEVAFDPPHIVPGEPTTLVYRIFLKQDRDRAIKEPGIGPPAGTISLGEKQESSGTTTDGSGERWTVQTCRWPLTASQPGTIEVRGQQEFFRCRRDFFNRLVAQSSHQLAVKPASLTVEALPSDGRPDDFSGLFGPLEVSALIERPRISAGEGTVLELSVRGRQVELLPRPSFTPPAGLQAYAKDDAAAKPVAGERRFRWDLVPTTAGSFAIPPFSLPYYDPVSRSYRRAASGALPLTVLPGRTREIVIGGNAEPGRPTPLTVPERPELPAPLRGQGPSRPQDQLGWLVATGGLALGLAAGAVQRRARRAPRPAHRGQALLRAVAARDAEQIWRAAQALLPDLDDPPRREAAQRLLRAGELARFGGQPLGGGLDGDAQLLAGLP